MDGILVFEIQDRFGEKRCLWISKVISVTIGRKRVKNFKGSVLRTN